MTERERKRKREREREVERERKSERERASDSEKERDRDGKTEGEEIDRETGGCKGCFERSCVIAGAGRSVHGAKNTHFKPPHAHVWRHAPDNPQNDAAVYH